MDSSFSIASSRKSYGLPKPETGLAEWTSKIKALQKEVDADEEAEQKRLEDEIAAARQARLSRSRGTSASRVNSADLSINKERPIFSNDQDTSPATDAPTSPEERKIHQATALGKLMERNDVYNPDKIATSGRVATGKQDGVSLAAFIGGSATGPRLNRHAPQPDAHDPTQFIQPDVSRPHPVFGKGGIAMPGMAAKNTKLSTADVGSEHSERYRPTSLASARSMSSLRSSNNDLTPTKPSDSIALNRRSFNGSSKPASPSPGQSSSDPLDTSMEGSGNPSYQTHVSPPTTSTQRSWNKEETTSSGENKQSTQTSFNSTPKSLPSAASQYSRGLAGSPTKSPEPSWAKQNSVNSGLRPTSVSPSYLQKTENIAGPKLGSSPTNQSADSFRSKSTSFTAPVKNHPAVTMSYLPKKEEAKPQISSPSQSTDTFRATPAASRPLPSYIGTTSTSSRSTPPAMDAAKPVADTPLRRLMERNNVYNPDKVDNSRKSVAERAQTVSLGAFMGGNGTGIRLNRHAPQPDATDPTQYIQPDISAPHPIFGKGGIAMPGMTGRKTDGPTGSEISERYRPSVTSRPTWPPVSTSRTEKAEERPVSPQKTGNRERTTSAPNSQVQTSLQSSSDRSSSNKVTGRQSPVKETRSESIRSRTISGPSYSDKHNVTRPLSSQSSGSTSSARPIQSTPKSSSSHISTTSTPSPAFQRLPHQKDLTPSLSRLQGRGFVQNMVKVSSQFETSPSPSRSPDKPRPLSTGGRTGSVLDRWQPKVQSGSPTKSSFSLSPTPTKQKAAIFESNNQANKVPAIKSSASLPSLNKAAETTTSRSLVKEPPETVEQFPRPRTPGLGSATTMVLIKPTKSSTDLTQFSHVDELGVKQDSWQGQQTDSTPYYAPAEVPPSSKKTLIHPAKDRPHKPREPNENLVNPQGEISMAADENGAESVEIRPKIAETSTLPGFDIHPPKEDSTQPSGLTIQTQNEGQFMSSSPAISAKEIYMVEKDTELQRSPSDSPISGESPSASALDMEVVAAPNLNRLSVQPIVPPSPTRHTRIPTTGNRPTVMEIAQTLLDNPVKDTISGNTFNTTIESRPDSDLQTSINVSSPAVVVQSTDPPTPRLRVPLSQIQAEKRRSSYERYSAIILPSLKEEATPAPSPANTMSRSNDVPKDALSLENITDEESSDSQISETASDDFEPPPDIDYSRFLTHSDETPIVATDVQTISVEVLVITGTTATPLSKSLDIFYDSEILVIVDRVKSKSTGLASTSVWCWLGRKCTFGDREERKVQDLATRYGTRAKIVHQFAEPPTLIHVLGGQLAIRQGTRTHWSSENTTMHLVRSLRGGVLIDEHDLSVQNLCSAFSYCITILGSVYVWHGCGSTLKERNAAVQYSQTFSSDSVEPIILTEGEDDDDEMFWMILGDEGFAKADYWKWRKSSIDINPSCWRVSTQDHLVPLIPVEFLSMEQDIHKSIYVINCIWEFFIVVGKEATGDRRTIKFALDLVTKLSMKASASRPYAPTVHVLILPSQVPLDLRIGIRDLDEAWLNDGEIPDHMSLMPASEASNHLLKPSWPYNILKDGTTLPLGIDSVFV